MAGRSLNTPDFERGGGGGGGTTSAQATTIADTQAAAALVARFNLLTTGEELAPRQLVTAEDRPVSGTLYLSYFTARKTETITKLQVGTSGTAATGTTLARVGIYTPSAGTLSLTASSTNDVALWSATYTAYQKTLSASWSKTAGTRYAMAWLFVGTGGPTLECIPVRYQHADQAPRIQGELASQTDLPASIPEANLATGFRMFHGLMLP